MGVKFEACSGSKQDKDEPLVEADGATKVVVTEEQGTISLVSSR
jgi:hypothetical protein